MYHSMKRTLRPLYTVLLLLALAGTLTLRVALHHHNGTSYLRYNAAAAAAAAAASASPPPPRPPPFNDTLLRFASVDAADAKLKKEIEDLLEGNFPSRGRQRSFLSSGKYHIDVRLRTARGMPLQLRSPEFHRIWQKFRRHLSDWARNRRFFHPDIMSELVNEIKSSIEDFNGVKRSIEKYRSCAVVGNSGILLKSDHGNLIDSHEIVIRLNNARIRGFERNVGFKTNISFANSNILHLCARREGCFCQPYGASVAMIMYICQPAHFLDYLVCNASHKSPLIVTDPRFDALCARIVKYYSLKRFVATTGKDPAEWASAHDAVNFHYSSGMQAVMVALGVCERVSVFGFGKSKEARHHYHTNQKAELSLHDYEAEYQFYRDLQRSEAEVAVPYVSDKFKFPPFVMYH